MRSVLGDSFEGVAHQSQLVHRPKPEKGRCPVSEQSFECTVCIIIAYATQFSRYAYWRKKERKSTISKCSCLALSTLLLAELIIKYIQQQNSEGMQLMSLFTFVCFMFHGAALIPYVQFGHFKKRAPSLAKKYYRTSSYSCGEENSTSPKYWKIIKAGFRSSFLCLHYI